MRVRLNEKIENEISGIVVFFASETKRREIRKNIQRRTNVDIRTRREKQNLIEQFKDGITRLMNREDDCSWTKADGEDFFFFSTLTYVLVERVDTDNSSHSGRSTHRVLRRERRSAKSNEETNLSLVHREREHSVRELIPFQLLFASFLLRTLPEWNLFQSMFQHTTEDQDLSALDSLVRHVHVDWSSEEDEHWPRREDSRAQSTFHWSHLKERETRTIDTSNTNGFTILNDVTNDIFEVRRPHLTRDSNITG